MEFHRASLTYFSIAALCLLKPLFWVNQTCTPFLLQTDCKALAWLALPDPQEGATAWGCTQLGYFPQHSGMGLIQWPSRERLPALLLLGEESVGFNTVLCSPRAGEAGIFCAEPQCLSQNTSKVVYFHGTEGTGAVCCVQPRLCNPQRLPRK